VNFFLKRDSNLIDPGSTKEKSESIVEVPIFNFKKQGKLLDDIILVSQLGLTMAGSILFCFAIGYFLDKWLGTKGLFITIFIILGIIGGGITVYRQIAQVVDIKGNKRSGSKKRDGRA
jgi:ATP synthase protein I